MEATVIGALRYYYIILVPQCQYHFSKKFGIEKITPSKNLERVFAALQGPQHFYIYHLFVHKPFLVMNLINAVILTPQMNIIAYKGASFAISIFQIKKSIWKFFDFIWKICWLFKT